MTERKAFNFYRSFHLVLSNGCLTEKDKLDLFQAVCSTEFLETNIEDIKFENKIAQLAWDSIKHSIEKSVTGYISKMKIKVPSKGSSYQEQEKVKDKEQEKVKYYSFPNTINSLSLVEWIEYRKLSDIEIKKTISFLESFTLIQQKEIIDLSIRSGYKSLFPPKKNMYNENDRFAEFENIIDLKVNQ